MHRDLACEWNHNSKKKFLEILQNITALDAEHSRCRGSLSAREACIRQKFRVCFSPAVQLGMYYTAAPKCWPAASKQTVQILKVLYFTLVVQRLFIKFFVNVQSCENVFLDNILMIPSPCYHRVKMAMSKKSFEQLYTQMMKVTGHEIGNVGSVVNNFIALVP